MEFVVPLVIGIIVVVGFIKKVPVFDTFLVGAKSGLITAYNIAPTIIGLIVAVTMLKSSGAMDLLSSAISPVADALGFPSEIVPMALLRPVSGSGTTALLSQLLNEHGPDSIIGRIASIMAGSTETTFYAITVYFGSVGIKNCRHTLAAGLIADFTAVLISVVSAKMYFT